MCGSPVPPHQMSARGIGGLGLDLGVDLAGALAGHRDLDAGLALEGGDHGAAPFLLHAAIHDERALRLRCSGGHEGQGRHGACQHGCRNESLLQFHCILP